MTENLTAWRNSSETRWFQVAPVQPLRYALKDVVKAYKGSFKGVGRIYQQTFVDTYSRVAFAKLYKTKIPDYISGFTE